MDVFQDLKQEWEGVMLQIGFEEREGRERGRGKEIVTGSEASGSSYGVCSVDEFERSGNCRRGGGDGYWEENISKGEDG